MAKSKQRKKIKPSVPRFDYGKPLIETTEVEQPEVKREVNWSFLFACLFGISTFALIIHVIVA
jgi:hypothetical protein